VSRCLASAARQARPHCGQTPPSQQGRRVQLPVGRLDRQGARARDRGAAERRQERKGRQSGRVATLRVYAGTARRPSSRSAQHKVGVVISPTACDRGVLTARRLMGDSVGLGR
jgi:hypothetical protein